MSVLATRPCCGRPAPSWHEDDTFWCPECAVPYNPRRVEPATVPRPVEVPQSVEVPFGEQEPA